MDIGPLEAETFCWAARSTLPWGVGRAGEAATAGSSTVGSSLNARSPGRISSALRWCSQRAVLASRYAKTAPRGRLKYLTFLILGAGEGIRTLDPNLGKVQLEVR